MSFGKQQLQPRLRILVDMDMVLCDFEHQLLKDYKIKHPNEPFIPLEDRRGFYARDQYVKQFKRDDLAVSKKFQTFEKNTFVHFCMLTGWLIP